MQTNARRAAKAPLLVMLAGVVWLVAGCTPSGPRALLQGEELIRKGNYEAAVEKLELATNLLPNEARAWNYLGVAHHRAGQYADARLAYERALKLDRNLAAARFNLGRMYMDQGVPISALEQLSTFAMLDPKSVEGWLLMADANVELLRYDQSLENYYAALRLDRNLPEAYNGIGWIYMQRNNPREAYRFFVEALKHDSSYTPAILNLAIVLHTKLDAKPLALAKYREYLSKAAGANNRDSIRAVADQLDRELNPPLDRSEPPVQVAALDTNALKLPVPDGQARTANQPVKPAKATNAAIATAPPETTVTHRVEPVPTNAIVSAAEKSPTENRPPATNRVRQPTVPPVTAPAPSNRVAAATGSNTGAMTNATETPARTNTTVTSTRSAPTSAPVTPVPVEDRTPPPSRPTAAVETPEEPARVEAVAASPRVADTAPREDSTRSEMPLEVVQLEVQELPREVDLPVAQETPDALPPAATEDAPLPVATSAPLPDTGAVATEAEEPRRGFFQRINPANLFRDNEGEPSQRTETMITPLPTRAGEEPPVSTPASAAPADPRQMASAGQYTGVTPLGSNRGAARYAYTVSGPPAPGDRAASERLFQRGLDAQTQLDPGRAASYFASAAMADPSYYPAQYNLGLLSYQTGQIMKSLSAFETALALDPNSADAAYNFALALQKARYPLDAAGQLTRLLEKYPDNVRAHLLLGNVYAQDLNDVPRARAQYQTVLELDPDHRQAPVIRAWLRNQP